MFGAQVAFAQALHDRLGLDTAVLHRNARAAHQVAVAAFVQDFGQFAPEHRDGAAVAVGRVDAGTTDFQDWALEVDQAVEAEFFFAVEPAQAAGGLVVEQASGRHEAAGVQVAYADVGAVNIIVIHVQTHFRALELGVEFAAEDVETQGLCFLQGLGADQAFGLQAAFIAGVADAGDLGHSESPCGLFSCSLSTFFMQPCCAKSGYVAPVSSP